MVRPTPARCESPARPPPPALAAATTNVATAPSSAPRPVPHAPSGPPAAAAHTCAPRPAAHAGAGAGHRRAEPWSWRWRPSASTPSSASPAARSCRPTTRCWTPPRSGTSWSGTSRAPDTRPRVTRRPPARSASAWPPAARARPTSSPRSPTPTWTRCPIVAITGQVPSQRDRHRRLPGGRHPRHHDADHQAQLPGHRRGRDPAGDRRGVPHRLAPAVPARSSSTSARTPCRQGRPSPGRRSSTCPATAR